MFGCFPRNSKNAQILLGVTPKRDFFRARKSIELADTLRVAENNQGTTGNGELEAVEGESTMEHEGKK